MNENAIEVRNVTMKFNLMEEKVDSIKEYAVKFLQRKLLFNEFIALDDVSFDIKKGDVFALIGFNGAGKSTMLKILAGVLKPTSGHVCINGNIAPLIEVGAGFDQDLTARENIFLNGAILGYSKDFLEAHFENIIRFAELEEFVNVPVKNFSSGMYARLGFAIATEVRPDILIVDEVLSVGDFKFQQKCEKRIREMISKGTTVVIVSHTIDLIKNICNRVLWLDHGKVKEYGSAETVCEKYEPSKMRGKTTRNLFSNGRDVTQRVILQKNSIRQVVIHPITWKRSYLDTDELVMSVRSLSGENLYTTKVLLNCFSDNREYSVDVNMDGLNEYSAYDIVFSLSRYGEWEEEFQLLTTLKYDSSMGRAIVDGKEQDWSICMKLI
ncbi:MAG: ABC transporter ATP-binding protein [Selenomonadaceae bacterium]|nr:ABC transporter ATP-binding protein [Selenomonadaceae bacterium]